MKYSIMKLGCVVFLLTINILSSFGKINKSSDNESFLDFEILDEQNKTCRLKKCVLNKPMKVVVPESTIISGQIYKLTSIGALAFSNTGCKKHLTHVILPSTITTIESGAFSNCDSLKQIVFPDNLKTIKSYAFYDCDGLVEITLPNTVTKIERFAFSHCHKLTFTYLPDSLEVVEEYAFRTSPLSQIFVPKSLTEIGVRSFDCPMIVDNENPNYSSEGGVLFDKRKKKLLMYPIDKQSYSIPKSVERIEGFAFESTLIKEVSIPNSVISIGKNAFLNCRELSEIVIPNSVETIGDSAFWQCWSLEKVTLSNSLKEIGGGMFEMCLKLTNIEIPNSVTEIGPKAFAKTSISNIHFPGSLVKIGNWAFVDCILLEQCTLPDSLSEIGKGAFYNCINLKQLTIPPSVKTIGDRAFPKDCEVDKK